MGGQAPQPQQQPIPVPPFGAPGQPAPAPVPAGGVKGGSLAGIPDLATLFNSQAQAFPNSLSFPKGGQVGVPGGQIPAPAVPQSPFDKLMAMLQGQGGGERELRRPDITAAQDVGRRLREGRARGTGIPDPSEIAAAESELGPIR